MEELNDAVKEFLSVLENCEQDVKEKIPENILNYFQKLASSSGKEFNIDKTKNLSDQNLSTGCQNIISLVYYSYLANDDEKKELKKSWIRNELI
jgi:hypothetical protein